MEQTLRQKAIAWWNSLPNRDKFMDDYFIEREESSLTGREIQSIYEAEHPINSEVKNYVGVSFKHKDKNDIYTVFDVEDDTVFYFNKYSEKSFRKLSDFERCLAKGEWVIVTESEVLPERPFVGLMPCKDLASAIHQHCFDYKNMETVVDGETIDHRIWDCYNTLFYVIKKWVEADEKDFIDYVKKSKPCLVGRECEWTDTVLPVHLYKIGDKAFLKSNPLDIQLGEYISLGFKTILEVKDTSEIKGTSGQWVKIAEYNDWLDSSYFLPIRKSIDESGDMLPKDKRIRVI